MNPSLKTLLAAVAGLGAVCSLAHADVNGYGGSYLRVLSAKYTLVARGFSSDDMVKFGDEYRWRHITLWGNFKNPPAENPANYEYRWDYGDGSPASNFVTVASFDYMDAPPIEYNVSGDLSIYVASLTVRRKGNPEVRWKTSVNVYVNDFSKFTPAYGHTTPMKDKREVLKSIASGRVLTWLYRQQQSDGFWPYDINFSTTAVPAIGTYSAGPTALVLAAFLEHQHGKGDATLDIFADCVEKGLTALLSRAHFQPGCNGIGFYTDLPAPHALTATEINWDRRVYEHGLALMALGYAYTPQRDALPAFSVAGKKLTYRQIVEKGIAWANWAQNDSDGIFRGGWRYSPYPLLNTHADLPLTQSVVLGLYTCQLGWAGTGVPQNDKNKIFSATSANRAKLLQYARASQFEWLTNPYNGAGFYDRGHGRRVLYDAVISSFTVLDANGQPEHPKLLTGTASLLSIFSYLSLDDPYRINVCGCGAAKCTDKTKDLRLRDDPFSGLSTSCNRIKYALRFLGSEWPYFKNTYLQAYDFYTYYSVFKGLDMIEPKDDEGNVVCEALPGINWKNDIFDALLKTMADDGNWAWNFYNAFAALILHGTVAPPPALRTDAPLPRPVFEKASAR